MEGTTKNTNRRANMTDTKIALGLLKHQKKYQTAAEEIRGKKTAKIGYMHLINILRQLTYMP